MKSDKPSRHDVQQHPVQAIGLMLAAVLMLSTMDVAFKVLVETYSSLQVTFFRCAASLPLFTVWILATGKAQFKTAYPMGQLIRGVIGLGMLYSVGECFRELQLADAYALFFAAPLLVTLLSGPMLGEPAGLVRILACVFGFSGVLIVLRPSGEGLMGYGAVMGLVAVVLYALSSILLRRLGHKDGTVTIAFWFVALVGLGSGLLAIPDWRPLERNDWLWLIMLGVSGALGQALITAAFRRASVAIVAPFDYTHMIWAVVYGYLLWGYLPGLETWIGGAILVASGLFILYRERRLMMKRTALALADPGGSPSQGSIRK